MRRASRPPLTVARSLISAEISETFLASAPLTIGVMRPVSVATAIDTSTSGTATGAPSDSLHCAFTPGTSLSATAAALTTRSLTEILTPCAASDLLNDATPSMHTSAA